MKFNNEGFRKRIPQTTPTPPGKASHQLKKTTSFLIHNRARETTLNFMVRRIQENAFASRLAPFNYYHRLNYYHLPMFVHPDGEF
jgi:hypothetical protein